MHAIGVNPVETYIRAGSYPQKPALPYTPGNDGAGVVEEVGSDVNEFKPGDRVYTAGSISGTYAEFALCKTAQVHPLPANASFAQGAAMGTESRNRLRQPAFIPQSRDYGESRGYGATGGTEGRRQPKDTAAPYLYHTAAPRPYHIQPKGVLSGTINAVSNATKNEMKSKMTTSYLGNSINPLPWRYGFFLIALVCLALSPTANNVRATTLRSPELGPNGNHSISNQLPAQGSSDNHHHPTIVTFDAPGAGTTGPIAGTFGQAINLQGAIVGVFITDATVYHGFLRAPNGTFTTFDAPGAGTGFGQGTTCTAINFQGDIVGFYQDASNVYHGFRRAHNGTFTTFNAAGAGTGPYQGTQAYNINIAGTIAGNYQDGNSAFHGFVRTANGTITTFNAPGGGTGFFEGTITAAADGLNQLGAIDGGVIDANRVIHGYVRFPNGAITTFDVPGAGTGAGQGTASGGINLAGTVLGYYLDGGNVYHGYVRSHTGHIDTFNVAGAGTGPGQGTIGQNINELGVIDGWYNDANGVAHGFVRSYNGHITTFDVPCAGTGLNQGTFIGPINQLGVITGWYVTDDNVYHGYLRIPEDD